MTERMKTPDEIARDAAHTITHAHHSDPHYVEPVVIIERAITAALAPVVKERDAANAKLKAMKGSIDSLERKRPLCPDCRDKCENETCLRCHIQAAEKRIAELEAELAEAKEEITSIYEGYETQRAQYLMADRERDQLQSEVKRLEEENEELKVKGGSNEHG